MLKSNTSAAAAVAAKMMQRPELFAGPNHYQGVFRGYVEDVVDPEKRGRVRVRVMPFNGDAPTHVLPWAERCFMDGGSNGYGTYTPLKGESSPGARDGDGVFVMFEGGCIDVPIVIGTWCAYPEEVTEMPEETQREGTNGHRRRHVTKTRHGHRIEQSDEVNQSEIKIVSARGDIIHIRESNGGRGIHVTSAGGHTVSLQDEAVGDSAAEVANAYDATPDLAHENENPRAVPVLPASSANGEVDSPTPVKGKGAGTQAIMIQTIKGHKIILRDTDPQGVFIETVGGCVWELNDALRQVYFASPNRLNSGLFQDGAGVSLFSEWGQEIFMEPAGFGIRWPEMGMFFTFGSGQSLWKINGSIKIEATGDIWIKSDGTLTEQGANRVEIPEVPSGW